MAKKSHPINIRLSDDEVRAGLVRIAKADRRSLSSLVANVMEDWYRTRCANKGGISVQSDSEDANANT